MLCFDGSQSIQAIERKARKEVEREAEARRAAQASLEQYKSVADGVQEDVKSLQVSSCPSRLGPCPLAVPLPVATRGLSRSPWTIERGGKGEDNDRPPVPQGEACKLLGRKVARDKEVFSLKQKVAELQGLLAESLERAERMSPEGTKGKMQELRERNAFLERQLQESDLRRQRDAKEREQQEAFLVHLLEAESKALKEEAERLAREKGELQAELEAERRAREDEQAEREEADEQVLLPGPPPPPPPCGSLPLRLCLLRECVNRRTIRLCLTSVSCTFFLCRGAWWRRRRS